MLFQYCLYGARIASELPFPELPDVSSSTPACITIRLAKVPSTLKNPLLTGTNFQVSPGEFLMRVDDVARIYVQNGEEILIEPCLEANPNDLRMLILGSPLGTALLQLGQLPLHGNAVTGPQGTFLFLGKSGVGKSTTSAALCQQGFSLIADDIAVVRKQGERFEVFPGVGQVKLWPDSIQALEVSKELPKVRTTLEKRILNELPFINDNEPRLIDGLFELKPQAAATQSPAGELLTQLHGLQKLTSILDNTYGAVLIGALGLRKTHFQLCSELAKALPMWRYARPAINFSERSLAAGIAELKAVLGSIARHTKITN